jgi:hypothetical protein
MNAWDLYSSVKVGLGFGRLTIETEDDGTILLLWRPDRWHYAGYRISARDLQRAGWIPDRVTHELREEYRRVHSGPIKFPAVPHDLHQLRHPPGGDDPCRGGQ